MYSSSGVLASGRRHYHIDQQAEHPESRGVKILTLGFSKVYGRKRVWKESAMIYGGVEGIVVSQGAHNVGNKTAPRSIRTYNCL